ncbi:30S ribosomal protein S6 [Candidatus Uhrbacteria bacterium RIFCSPHIGHO2_12_FULL_54_23]|uniref:Small ribosomal subunit protein bS6 n=3 Tax=Candidatus Uhriibacteriota TaxID=1752732 RepID=A0A1F7UJL2_9BACT|nr:MAG: 30S ribosomal protein S6 [Candidatus Uhrbacteria bacterium RIFCSPHIGHO2_12_FULL_54_23]OGL85545.1 MAG: 30S ribosomal protein S6 [Candidatus Uhrbacteria bacterium RIFCSPLOWO2_01_FULL_55_36]OGL89517.1 MAG: 30S ribosomal protein S6 [Candidatus Uhrbacteria bacterium RIFCSPLOWO2_02_FULL_54_37]
MRYDLLYLLPLRGEDAPPQDMQQKIGALLKDAKATIVREEDPGKRRLAYPIGRARYGFYGNVLFEADTADVMKLKESLTLETGVIRFQIVREEQTAPKKLKSARVKPKRPTMIPTAVTAPIAPAARVPAHETVDLAALDKKLEELLSDEVAS